jgi:hypothetical protein
MWTASHWQVHCMCLAGMTLAAHNMAMLRREEKPTGRGVVSSAPPSVQAHEDANKAHAAQQLPLCAVLCWVLRAVCCHRWCHKE